MIIQIGGAVLGVIRVLICLFLIAEILHIQRPSLKEIVLSCVASAAFECAILLVLQNSNQLIQFGGEAVLAALLAERFQKGKRKICLFVSIYSLIAMGLCEFLAGVLLGVTLQNQLFLDRRQMQGVISGWVSVAFLIFAIGVLLFAKVKREVRTRILYAISFLMIFALVSLSEQEAVTIPQETLIMWIILAMNLMVGVLVFNMNKQYAMEKQLAELNAEQAALLEKDYTDLNNMYAMNAKLFHDFHNHIGMLRQLVSSEKYGETIAYLDELQAPMREMSNAKWTGEQTIDYLINEKLAAAAECGIDMQVQVEYPNHSNIKSVDMCAIIGNLIDNALEATRQVSKENERYIHFVIRRIHQMLVIKVENSFEKKLIQEDGRLKTTKTEGGLHGWGMKSVETAVDKYEGTVQHSQDGNKFTVVATLSFEGIDLHTI